MSAPGRRIPGAAWLLALATAVPAHAAETALVFVAPANHAMPFVDVRDGRLTGGILKDLGEAIATRAGLQARFLIVPAKRVSAALEQGEADALCYTAPGWIDAKHLQWSRPIFDYAGVVARGAGVPPVQHLGQLAGERLGTVAGYRYPEVEQALGGQFLRDDAPDMGRNLAKLGAGRVRYALTEKLTLAYAMREPAASSPQPALTTIRYATHCVFGTRRPKVPLTVLDRAVDSLLDDATVERILSRYR